MRVVYAIEMQHFHDNGKAMGAANTLQTLGYS